MNSRPPFESAYIYILLAVVGFMAADLTILSVRDKMLPEKAPPAKVARSAARPAGLTGNYPSITQRNIFNSDRKIADPLGAGKEASPDNDGPPVLSQLPLQLVGTIVHLDPKRSVATINVRNRNEVMAFKPDESIEGLATLVKVERAKVIFRNSSTSRLEFIEIPKDARISFGAAKGVQQKSGDVIQKSETEFALKRSDLLKYTSNLSDILQQARAVPNIVPGSGGRVDGFRLLDIQPGSIYEQLGLKRGDVIKSVNGEPVDSPNKAMELYNQLKTASGIEIGIDRDGRPTTMNYNVE